MVKKFIFVECTVKEVSHIYSFQKMDCYLNIQFELNVHCSFLNFSYNIVQNKQNTQPSLKSITKAELKCGFPHLKCPNYKTHAQINGLF